VIRAQGRPGVTARRCYRRRPERLDDRPNALPCRGPSRWPAPSARQTLQHRSAPVLPAVDTKLRLRNAFLLRLLRSVSWRVHRACHAVHGCSQRFPWSGRNTSECHAVPPVPAASTDNPEAGGSIPPSPTPLTRIFAGERAPSGAPALHLHHKRSRDSLCGPGS
jgi:hypothetical protein